MIRPTAIPGAVEIRPRRFTDTRGFLVETWSRGRLAAAGIDVDFVQDNLSWSQARGTVRGLHFQRAPHAQAKLVTCLAGAILDVVVDIRRGSPTFGRHVAVELNAESGHQLYVPEGCAHGFCTLAPDTLVSYKLSSPYAPAAEAGIVWNDPALAIAWPVGEADAVLSDKDRALPRFAALAAVA